MRVTRGLLAGLGASGCMAAAGACILLAVSATIGVRGWPGLSRDPVSGQTISARPVAAPAHPPRQRLGGSSGPVAHAAARHILAATEAATSDLPPRPAGASAPRPTSSAPAAAAPSSASTSAAAPSAPPAGPGAPKTTTPVGDTVRGTGEAVGNAVAPVSPTVAQTVTGTTDAAGNAVDGVLKP